MWIGKKYLLFVTAVISVEAVFFVLIFVLLFRWSFLACTIENRYPKSINQNHQPTNRPMTNVECFCFFCFCFHTSTFSPSRMSNLLTLKLWAMRVLDKKWLLHFVMLCRFIEMFEFSVWETVFPSSSSLFIRQWNPMFSSNIRFTFYHTLFTIPNVFGFIFFTLHFPSISSDKNVRKFLPYVQKSLPTIINSVVFGFWFFFCLLYQNTIINC